MAIQLNELIECGKFVMVSYRRKDSAVVFDDIRNMKARGIRVWYDEAMELGDNWKHVAEHIIKHPNCACVIFYNSENSFLSKPVFQERAWTRERLAECRSLGVPYVYFSVNIGRRSTNEIIRDTYASIGTASTESVFPFEYLKDIVNMFDEEVICVLRGDDSVETVNTIYEKVKKLDVVDDESVIMENMLKKGKFSIEGNNTTMLFGSYPQCSVEVKPISDNYGKAHFKQGGKEYRYENGKYYEYARIKWIYAGKTDDGLIFVADRLLFTCTAIELNAKLSEFYNEGFSNSEQAKIIDLPYVWSVSDAERNPKKVDLKASATDYVGKTVERWWLSDKGKGGKVLTMCVNDSGEINYRGFNSSFKLCVRPAIKIRFK